VGSSQKGGRDSHFPFVKAVCLVGWDFSRRLKNLVEVKLVGVTIWLSPQALVGTFSSLRETAAAFSTKGGIRWKAENKGFFQQ